MSYLIRENIKGMPSMPETSPTVLVPSKFSGHLISLWKLQDNTTVIKFRYSNYKTLQTYPATFSVLTLITISIPQLDSNSEILHQQKARVVCPVLAPALRRSNKYIYICAHTLKKCMLNDLIPVSRILISRDQADS